MSCTFSRGWLGYFSSKEKKNRMTIKTKKEYENNCVEAKDLPSRLYSEPIACTGQAINVLGCC